MTDGATFTAIDPTMNLQKICLFRGYTDMANVDLIYVQEGREEKATNSPPFTDTTSAVELQATQRSHQSQQY